MSSVVLGIHALAILVLTLAPLAARTQEQRIVYLRVLVAVTLQWVLLGGRCSLSIIERSLRPEDDKGSEACGVWKRLSEATGIREESLIAANMASYVVGAAGTAAVVGTREAGLLAAAVALMTLVAALQWKHRQDIEDGVYKMTTLPVGHYPQVASDTVTSHLRAKGHPSQIVVRNGVPSVDLSNFVRNGKYFQSKTKESGYVWGYVHTDL